MTRNHPSSFRIATLAVGIGVAFACLLNAGTASAHQPDSQVVYDQAIELRCAADDMRDEIKTHFRGTKCYRKMLGTALQIETRSAAISRRTKRNACYRGMDRDVAKVNELVCELTELYESTMRLNSAGIGRRCVVGETVHVVEKLSIMADLAGCMRLAADGLVALPVFATYSTAKPTLVPQTLIISEYDPNIDIAPGVTPPTQIEFQESYIERPYPTGQLDHNQGTTLPSATPTLNGPTPVYRSIIER